MVHEFNVTSGYGAQKQEPYVELNFQGVTLQISPENARDIALSILRAVEASYSDAFLIEFAASEAVGLTIEEAAVLLREFRAWRVQQQKW